MLTTTSRPAPLLNRLLRVPQVCQRLSVSRGTLWNIRCRDASFPKAVRISEGLIGFHEAEVTAWIAARPLADEVLRSDEEEEEEAPSKAAALKRRAVR